MSYAIETVQLTKYYNGLAALNGLSIQVPHGKSVGFLGPNGAGKTTTIKILTALISPTFGGAYIDGIDVLHDSKRALSDVGTIVETPEFYPYLTPKECLAYLGKLRGMSSQEIQERSDALLWEVKLQEWANKKIGTFSRGMKQRVAIASALLHDPSLLILDEPTNGLDPRGMVEVRAILKSLTAAGRTVFMSTHLLAEVQETCDTVILVDKGRLVTQQEVAALGVTLEQMYLELIQDSVM